MNKKNDERSSSELASGSAPSLEGEGTKTSENIPGLTLALLRQIRRENALFRSEMIARHAALQQEIEIASGLAVECLEIAGDFLTRTEKRFVALNNRMRRIEARLSAQAECGKVSLGETVKPVSTAPQMSNVQGGAGNVSQFKR